MQAPLCTSCHNSLLSEIFNVTHHYKTVRGIILSCFKFGCFSFSFKSLPHNKFLDWSKLKAFADDKLNATEKLKFVLGRVENIVGKGENAGYQHFLLFPQCFQKPSLSGSLKVGIVW